MKKTLSANISGIVFHIDEDAYDKLNHYLGSIRRHFSADEGCEEIISGIEGRIAEMFQERIKDNRQVISIDDVKEVIGQLGEPEQISGEETYTKESPGTGPATEKGPKRLYRDPDDKYIGGVCGGLGAFFQIDPTWMRILFLVGIFAGFGIVLYLILWIVIPKARTTAEKLEMRGEKVNLSNIERSIKEDIQDIKRNLKDLSEETKDAFKKKSPDTNDNALRSVIQAIIAVIGVIFRIVGAIVGVVVILLGVLLLTTLVTALFFGPVSISSPFNAWLFSCPHFFSVVFTTHWMTSLATIALVLTAGIPLVVLIYIGLKLIFNFEGRLRGFGIFLFFLWMVGLALSIFVSINAAREFTAHRSIRTEHVFEAIPSSTIYLDLNQQSGQMISTNDYPFGILGLWDTSQMEATGDIRGIPRFRIREHASDEVKLIVTKESRGGSYLRATQKTENIDYTFSQQDSLLRLDPFFSFNKSDGWRVQKLLIELMVPEDKTVEISPQLRRWML